MKTPTAVFLHIHLSVILNIKQAGQMSDFILRVRLEKRKKKNQLWVTDQSDTKYDCAHQAALLKLRERALKEKTQAELAWLEQQKHRLRNKGADTSYPLLNKKRRGLLLRLKQEQVRNKLKDLESCRLPHDDKRVNKPDKGDEEKIKRKQIRDDEKRKRKQKADKEDAESCYLAWFVLITLEGGQVQPMLGWGQF